MLRPIVLQYAKQRFGIDPEYPWRNDLRTAGLRHSGRNNWFAFVASVPRNQLGLEGEGEVDILTVKCNSHRVGAIRRIDGIMPAHHVKSVNWISALLDGSVSRAQILHLMEDSFTLTS